MRRINTDQYEYELINALVLSVFIRRIRPIRVPCVLLAIFGGTAARFYGVKE